MTTTIETGALNSALRTLKLSGMLETIEGRLAQARAGELGHIDFLQVLCEDEITRRASMSVHRRLRAARFDEQVTLEGFDFTASPKLPAAQIRDLAALLARKTELFTRITDQHARTATGAPAAATPTTPEGRTP
jgi:DNA replication protein DnaC